ncbi:chitobiase/beta-hexosaminidase C-terminal domain-containing protein [Paenibacillus sp. 1P07SE]|uniref:chitobiase/beta-hexosaminidase C-terminal domain-containing protein n=1 Tax=Paenibacillus sp. 1P07SE TaxID=3132209 RepID=UPI0039A400B3
MKKRMGVMLVLLSVGATLLGTAGNQADASVELTAQQKFDALKEKGILSGFEGGDARLDQNMTRAQVARVTALLTGLEGIGTPNTKEVTEKPFEDVSLDAWYVGEIGAVKEAGFMEGYTDGRFDPSKDITFQEMAVVLVRALDLHLADYARVEGASDWAARHIKALIDEGFDLPTNYKEAATRSDLVSVTYQADLVITSKENEIKAEELRVQEELRIAEERKKEEDLKKEEELKKAEEERLAEEEQSKSTEPPLIFYPIPSPNPIVVNPTPVPVLTVATPTILPAGGAVESGTLVSLSVTDDATIYYTTDGSTPTRTNGHVYSAPIVVDRDMTIQALAVHQGMIDSQILSTSYTITVQPSALDWINEASASGDWTGIDASTFTNAEISGVTADNLISIQYYLETDATPMPRTPLQIQSIVDAAIEDLSVQAIFYYLNPFGGGSRPTVEVFESAGITGVDASNLDAILDELSLAYQESRSNPFATPMSTKQDIQDVVDLFIR